MDTSCGNLYLRLLISPSARHQSALPSCTKGLPVTLPPTTTYQALRSFLTGLHLILQTPETGIHLQPPPLWPQGLTVYFNKTSNIFDILHHRTELQHDNLKGGRLLLEAPSSLTRPQGRDPVMFH
ncbi:hypothetical protein Q8A73_020976 [Channa argus]|nr:hypothetical protein Q8A73_020976 [Channa argus]